MECLPVSLMRSTTRESVWSVEIRHFRSYSRRTLEEHEMLSCNSVSVCDVINHSTFYGLEMKSRIGKTSVFGTVAH